MPYTLKINVNYIDHQYGRTYTLPGLLTDKGIVISHLRYLAFNSNKSSSWQERSVFAIKLLISYINANPHFDTATKLLKAFSLALYTGTIDYKDYKDPLDLYWRPRSPRDASGILSHITKYTDYLAQQDGYEHSLSNPFRKANSYEVRLNWCAYYHKNSSVFLNHLISKNDYLAKIQQVRLIGNFDSPLIDIEPAVRFPDDQFRKLLDIGCVLADGSIDYKLQAMIILMNLGGIRKSELFHIFVGDITLNPNHPSDALVRIFHPELGASPDKTFSNRKEFLEATTKYVNRNSYPRNQRLFAGWKNPLLTSRSGYFEVFFCPSTGAKLFLEKWVKYLKFQRVEPPADKPHPFAFTQLDGSPETLKNFNAKYMNAIKKIGLDYKKYLGTTEHGHRHAYGYRTKQLGLDPVEMQKAMHHKSPTSHHVYTQPDDNDLREKMNELGL